MFEFIDIDQVIPVQYNPRRINEKAFQKLKRSISKFGCLKPIIITKAGFIVAGHQRVKALKELGFTKVPAVILTNMCLEDEVRFNQMHNITDINFNSVITVPANHELVNEFELIPPTDINTGLKAAEIEYRKTICRLVAKYGNWGSIVATQSGKVIACHHYAMVCKLLNMPCRVYRVLDKDETELVDYLSANYGEFSYEHIKKEVWLQSYAQFQRLRPKERRVIKSPLYEKYVLPYITRKMRVLDFACGFGDYVKDLSGKGYNIIGVELFSKKEGVFDLEAVNQMCDRLAFELKMRGLFDVIVCDTVLNATCTKQYEIDILNCLSALLKPNGDVFLSGRSRAYMEDRNVRTETSTDNRNYHAFLDQDGFSALLRYGGWYYQRFHTKKEVEDIAEHYFGAGSIQNLHYTHHSASWQMHCKKLKELSIDTCQQSLVREFNIDLSNTNKLNKHEKVIEAWNTARGKHA